MSETVLGGLAAIVTVLVIGAIFGRVHGSKSERDLRLGDRVMSGLLAVPLISVLVYYGLPEPRLGWALAAPLPLFVYLILLAATAEKEHSRRTSRAADEGSGEPNAEQQQASNRFRDFVRRDFTEILLGLIGFLYLVAVVIAVIRAV